MVNRRRGIRVRRRNRRQGTNQQAPIPRISGVRSYDVEVFRDFTFLNRRNGCAVGQLGPGTGVTQISGLIIPDTAISWNIKTMSLNPINLVPSTVGGQFLISLVPGPALSGRVLADLQAIQTGSLMSSPSTLRIFPARPIPGQPWRGSLIQREITRSNDSRVVNPGDRWGGFAIVSDSRLLSGLADDAPVWFARLS
ncbi:coat protein [Epirus cherry virus]|uniref:Coat protein n=1 Tax=Epirus cherry virus TaxID=544686 RepID=B3VML0_9VIRU|nr:coat protein [Epirus cherry virus]ACF16359.1 coat protein [Epirus cherry virus]